MLYMEPERFDQKESNISIQQVEVTSQNEHIECQLCYKIALDASLCSNQKCSKIICKKCINNLTQQYQALQSHQRLCPFCRTDFASIPHPNKQKINETLVKCNLCTEPYMAIDAQKHFKSQCTYFLKIKCKFCHEIYPKSKIIEHTKIDHHKQLESIIHEFYFSNQVIGDPAEVVESNKHWLSTIGKFPKLGTTGKFYCAGPLGSPKCTCCNGYCGPTNGQNCFECMKLDIQRLGLKKGQLLNANGNICWEKQGKIVCGVMLGYKGYNCGISSDEICRPCQRMDRNIIRYKQLLE